MSHILVVGGAGYIGSHVCVELIEAGYEIVVVDNFSTSKHSAISNIEMIAGEHVRCIEASMGDFKKLQAELADVDLSGAIHMAGSKSVPASVADPLFYYDNNVAETIALFRFLKSRNIRRVVFSSSASVYAESDSCPIQEDAPIGPCSPYGRTKFYIEELLRDLARSNTRWQAANLRYFNPVGAHPSALIGEDPAGPPGNLFPIIAEAITGRRSHVEVFGTDYPTADGTGVRDYVHICDVARAHVDALRLLERSETNREWTFNLGTGRGYSVLEVLETWAEVSGIEAPYQLRERRPGDTAKTYADPKRAWEELGWRAKRDLDEMCRDHLRWAEAMARQIPKPARAGRVSRRSPGPVFGPADL
jgi:UDP-glucose 4-epimerase